MTFSDDIIVRISTDFGDRGNEATKILIDAFNKYDYLEKERIIRCLIFLARGDLTDLNKYIEAATLDPRDVMFWAEYEGTLENENPKRVRDFSKPFDK